MHMIAEHAALEEGDADCVWIIPHPACSVLLLFSFWR